MSEPTPVKKGKENRIGLDKGCYSGAASTLCLGCGHDSITAAIVQAYWDMGVNPYQVAKISGIGCSSKTPAYFLRKSHGFNSVHGRMPSVATGAGLVNKDLHILGVSGDGDSASIGMGQFVHLLRRNINMTYIVENNGTYGLTKGQFSATADVGSKLKGGQPNNLPPVDLCELAIQLDCSFVARGFAGDRKQLITLLKAAHSHQGTALIDVLSPCVTFNDHEGSTKSYNYIRDHYDPIAQADFIPSYDPIEIEHPEGTSHTVTLHDGSKVLLTKIKESYDPSRKAQALSTLERAKDENKIVTGLVYAPHRNEDFATLSNLVDTPLCHLSESELRPSQEVLQSINDSMR